MKEKKNQSQTTVEVEKTKVSLIDFGATIPYNLDEGKLEINGINLLFKNCIFLHSLWYIGTLVYW